MSMKHLFLCMALWCLSTAVTHARTFDMKRLGADLTGIKPCTDLINRAIDEAAAEGGGTIYFPAGTYLTATIRMKSNITFHTYGSSQISTRRKINRPSPFGGSLINRSVY